MSTIQYSANISNGFLFNETEDLIERYRAARKAGFQFVECGMFYDHPVENLTAILEETNLKQVLVNSFPGSNPGDNGQVVLDISDEEFEVGVRKSITYAKAMGSSTMHLLAGMVPEGKTRSELWSLYLRRLKWTAQQCLPRHLTVVIEPISPFVSGAYFLNSFGLAVDALAEVRQSSSRFGFVCNCKLRDGEKYKVRSKVLMDVFGLLNQFVATSVFHDPGFSVEFFQF